MWVKGSWATCFFLYRVLLHTLYSPQVLLKPTWAGLITTVFPAARQAAVFQESIIRG